MKFRTFSLLKYFSTVPKISPKICVVGSGPAGFYAAQYMANRLENAQIDIIERLPVPFGLVRYNLIFIYYVVDYFEIFKVWCCT